MHQAGTQTYHGVASARPLLFFLLTVLLIGYGLPALAMQGEIYTTPKQATIGKRLDLVIGLPRDYEERGIPKYPCQNVDNHIICTEYVYGNEYQLLEWIENAKVHGAYVSSVSVFLMQKLAKQKFGDHFYLFRIGKDAENYSPVIAASADSKPIKDPLEAYHQILDSLAQGVSTPEFSLNFDSHLDSTLFALYMETRDWMKRNNVGEEKAVKIWNTLIEQLSFRGADIGKENQKHIFFEGATARDCQSREALSCLVGNNRNNGDRKESGEKKGELDYLVLRGEIMDEELSQKLFGQLLEPVGDDYAHDCDTIQKGEKIKNEGLVPVCNFFERNYSSYEYGARIKRYFRFRIPELFDILQPANTRNIKTGGDNSLALVLTGGGVKSAYQTYLIDYLYDINKTGKQYLHNSYDSVEHENASDESGFIKPLEVKHVIGTSGGALLGLFVSTHADDKPVNYSDILWKDPDTEELLTSSKVFPLFDLMRWLSFVGTLLVFTLVLTFFSHQRSFRKKFSLEPEDSVKLIGQGLTLELDKKNRFMKFTLVWVLFLLITPWIIKFVNGDAYEEHIPAIQGFIYFIYVLIAVNTDNHIVRNDTDRVVRDKMPVPKIVLTVIGLILAIVPILYVYITENPGEVYEFLKDSAHIKITIPSFICATGLLIIAWFMRYWYLERSPDFSQIEGGEKTGRRSFYIPLLVVGFTFIISYVFYKLEVAAILELDPGFWLWCGIVSLLLSVAVVVAGFVASETNWLRQKLEPSLRYLILLHPSKTFLVSMNRINRMFFLFAFSWLWWNIVVAPGLYGNDAARQYLASAWERVVETRLTDKGQDLTTGEEVKFSTFFVAPATSLEKQIERYFLFNPSLNTKSIRLPYNQQIQLSADRRWTQIEEKDFSEKNQYEEFVIDIAFASGSPFPVFPAHKIGMPNNAQGGNKTAEKSNDGKPVKEWLVDGGYAHNIPVEAAKQLGASRVLVMSSSPMVPEIIGKESDSFFQFGLMIQNLPRLLPYFYSRSQVEDELSAEDMIVATIAPTIKPEEWYFLAEFRSKVIKHIFSEAKQDIHKRVGYVQNWGSPDNKQSLGTNQID